MSNEVLGFDCDENEIYEFEIIRPIWYSDLDFTKETNINPRQYVALKSSSGKAYLVSVYDHWEKRAINLFEGRNPDDDVPRKILLISEACHYEKAYDCNGDVFEYTISKEEHKKLVRKIDSIQKQNRKV